jgi:hypothetical protein
MVKRKKRGKVSVKPVTKDICNMDNYKCSLMFGKLSAMAFILFLITVWPAIMDLVHNLHWGWFLGAMIIFCILSMKESCCKK